MSLSVSIYICLSPAIQIYRYIDLHFPPPPLKHLPQRLSYQPLAPGLTSGSVCGAAKSDQTSRMRSRVSLSPQPSLPFLCCILYNGIAVVNMRFLPRTQHFKSQIKNLFTSWIPKAFGAPQVKRIHSPTPPHPVRLNRVIPVTKILETDVASGEEDLRLNL